MHKQQQQEAKSQNPILNSPQISRHEGDDDEPNANPLANSSLRLTPRTSSPLSPVIVSSPVRKQTVITKGQFLRTDSRPNITYDNEVTTAERNEGNMEVTELEEHPHNIMVCWTAYHTLACTTDQCLLAYSFGYKIFGT